MTESNNSSGNNESQSTFLDPTLNNLWNSRTINKDLKSRSNWFFEFSKLFLKSFSEKNNKPFGSQKNKNTRSLHEDTIIEISHLSLQSMSAFCATIFEMNSILENYDPKTNYPLDQIISRLTDGISLRMIHFLVLSETKQRILRDLSCGEYLETISQATFILTKNYFNYLHTYYKINENPILNQFETLCQFVISYILIGLNDITQLFLLHPDSQSDIKNFSLKEIIIDDGIKNNIQERGKLKEEETEKEKEKEKETEKEEEKMEKVKEIEKLQEKKGKSDPMFSDSLIRFLSSQEENFLKYIQIFQKFQKSFRLNICYSKIYESFLKTLKLFLTSFESQTNWDSIKNILEFNLNNCVERELKLNSNSYSSSLNNEFNTFFTILKDDQKFKEEQQFPKKKQLNNSLNNIFLYSLTLIEKFIIRTPNSLLIFISDDFLINLKNQIFWIYLNFSNQSLDISKEELNEDDNGIESLLKKDKEKNKDFIVNKQKSIIKIKKRKQKMPWQLNPINESNLPFEVRITNVISAKRQFEENELSNGYNFNPFINKPKFFILSQELCQIFDYLNVLFSLNESLLNNNNNKNNHKSNTNNNNHHNTNNNDNEKLFYKLKLFIIDLLFDLFQINEKTSKLELGILYHLKNNNPEIQYNIVKFLIKNFAFKPIKEKIEMIKIFSNEKYFELLFSDYFLHELNTNSKNADFKHDRLIINTEEEEELKRQKQEIFNNITDGVFIFFNSIYMFSNQMKNEELNFIQLLFPSILKNKNNLTFMKKILENIIFLLQNDYLNTIKSIELINFLPLLTKINFNNINKINKTKNKEIILKKYENQINDNQNSKTVGNGIKKNEKENEKEKEKGKEKGKEKEKEKEKDKEKDKEKLEKKLEEKQKENKNKNEKEIQKENDNVNVKKTKHDSNLENFTQKQKQDFLKLKNRIDNVYLYFVVLELYLDYDNIYPEIFLDPKKKKIIKWILIYLDEPKIRNFAFDQLFFFLTRVKENNKINYLLDHLMNMFLIKIQGEKNINMELMKGILRLLIQSMKENPIPFKEWDGQELFFFILYLLGNTNTRSNLLLSILKLLNVMFRTSSTFRNGFKQVISYTRFAILLSDILKLNYNDNVKIFQELLNFLVFGEYFNIRKNFLITNTDAIKMLFSLYSENNFLFFPQLIEIFYKICKNSINNTFCLCKIGMISSLTLLVPNITQKTLLEKIFKFIKFLGKVSISVFELKLLFKLLNNPNKNISINYKPNLILLIKEMININQYTPINYFSFDGKDSCMILPKISWPNEGYSFCTWIYLESFYNVSKDINHKPCIYSFVDEKLKNGIQIFLDLSELNRSHESISSVSSGSKKIVPNLIISIKNINKTEKKKLKFRFPIQKRKWYLFTLVHTSQSKWNSSKEKIILYLNKKIIGKRLLKYPLELNYTNNIIGANIYKNKNNQLKRKNHFYGKMSNISFFKTIFSQNNIGFIYELGPNFNLIEQNHFINNINLTSFNNNDRNAVNDDKKIDDNTINKNEFNFKNYDKSFLNSIKNTLFLYYNSNFIDDHLCIDQSKLNKKRSLNGKLINMVNYQIKKITNIIHCIGGIKIFLPLFSEINNNSIKISLVNDPINLLTKKYIDFYSESKCIL
ncbi:beach domain-containing protein lvsc [Anaeramoeba flamelloides]|uniref:Beach domain-containing protein lvsc n=1 Tax=Anaeramoeba flamelloides TaxID=1746091 RepID=A0ABQ8XYG9_9EUKA|nr:beach domain-containing protein lvsc [Anaeramoeba flamelloides]